MGFLARGTARAWDLLINSFGREVGFPGCCAQFNNYLVLVASADSPGPMRVDSLPVIFEQFYIHTRGPGSQVRQSKHLTSWNLFIRLEGTD